MFWKFVLIHRDKINFVFNVGGGFIGLEVAENLIPIMYLNPEVSIQEFDLPEELDI